MLRQSMCSRPIANSEGTTIGAIRVIDEYGRQPAIFYDLDQGGIHGRPVENNPINGCVPNRFKICRRAEREKQEGKPAAFQSSGDSQQELLGGAIIEPELQGLAVQEANRIG